MAIVITPRVASLTAKYLRRSRAYGLHEELELYELIATYEHPTQLALDLPEADPPTHGEP